MGDFLCISKKYFHQTLPSNFAWILSVITSRGMFFTLFTFYSQTYWHFVPKFCKRFSKTMSQLVIIKSIIIFWKHFYGEELRIYLFNLFLHTYIFTHTQYLFFITISSGSLISLKAIYIEMLRGNVCVRKVRETFFWYSKSSLLNYFLSQHQTDWRRFGSQSCAHVSFENSKISTKLWDCQLSVFVLPHTYSRWSIYVPVFCTLCLLRLCSKRRKYRKLIQEIYR